MDPCYLTWTEFRMGLIQPDARHFYLVHHLAMVGLSPLGGDLLKAVHGLEVHRIDVSRSLITDAPSLTFQQPLHNFLGQLAPGQQGAFPLRELLRADGTAQPFDVLVLPCPRPMGDVTFTRM